MNKYQNQSKVKENRAALDKFNQCSRKKPFQSPEEAYKVAPPNQSVYKCKHCNKYHLTKSPLNKMINKKTFNFEVRTLKYNLEYLRWEEISVETHEHFDPVRELVKNYAGEGIYYTEPNKPAEEVPYMRIVSKKIAYG